MVNQKVALSILEKFGLCADAVANGLEALQALQAIPYDLVLMDVQMPEMDGLEATRRIRAAEGGQMVGRSDTRTVNVGEPGFDFWPSRRMPIIAMTAGAMQEDREQCLEAGMDDYVAKPVSLDALARVLRPWLPA